MRLPTPAVRVIHAYRSFDHCQACFHAFLRKMRETANIVIWDDEIYEPVQDGKVLLVPAFCEPFGVKDHASSRRVVPALTGMATIALIVVMSMLTHVAPARSAEHLRTHCSVMSNRRVRRPEWDYRATFDKRCLV